MSGSLSVKHVLCLIYATAGEKLVKYDHQNMTTQHLSLCFLILG